MSRKRSEGLERPSARLLCEQRIAEEVAVASGLASSSGPLTLERAARITLQNVAVSAVVSRHGSLLADSVALNMEAIKAGLGYETAPTLERLLIEQIALCWLRVGEAEAMYSQVHSASHVPAQSAYADRRLAACTARYLGACESLARVRRLSRGVVVQVNMANQQIVTGGA
jgi:hypothetical protein